MMNKAGIYKITNSETGRFYIGGTVDIPHRKRFHLRSLKNGTHFNSYMQDDASKHGYDKFIVSVLLYCGRNDIKMYEQMMIDGLGAFHELNGYNICPKAGKTGGRKLSCSHKEKISNSLIGNNRNTGRVMTDEAKKRISESVKLARKNKHWSTRKIVVT